jgi:UDP-2,4-diacetamido-2,4,6-trideoxy-beta-L-altropyranose hydrolase
MNILIRTDASARIGSGHVMRCLVLAKELKRNGATVKFICQERPGNLITLIKKEGFEVFNIPFSDSEKKQLEAPDANSLSSNWHTDADVVGNIIRNENNIVDWLIVDHYEINSDWESSLRSLVKNIMVIDDLADRNHDCDVLLDQNYYIKKDRYNGLVPQKCHCLLGPRYSLLNSEFANSRVNLSEHTGEINNILIFFGSSDLNNETSKALKAINELIPHKDLTVKVVVGAINPHQVEINRIISQMPNVSLHVQVKNMSEVIKWADLAIGAGGSTTWERCCLGLPSLVVTLADNQIEVARDVARVGAHILLGNAADVSASILACHVRSLFTSPSLVSHISAAATNLVDGKGTSRVVEKIMPTNLGLRLATENDCESLHKWRNSDEVRLSSFDTSLISWERHVKWFKSVLSDRDRSILIGEINDCPVGVLRYDFKKNTAEVSVYMVPEMIGRGFGVPLLNAGNNWLKANMPNINTIESKVQPFNEASRKLFKKVGFKEEYNFFQFKL